MTLWTCTEKWSVSPELIMLTTGEWKNEPNGHLRVKVNTISNFLCRIGLYFFLVGGVFMFLGTLVVVLISLVVIGHVPALTV